MRRLFCLVMFFAVLALFTTPVFADTTETPWMLDAQVGPAFGTFGTTPNISTHAGYKMSDRVSVVGEFGSLSHAPFEKASAVAPAVKGPDVFSDAKVHVNGYHYNANLIVTPTRWGRITPYVTGGVGAFKGSTVAEYIAGPTSERRYEASTSFATNVGGGLSYRVDRWLGLNADYRHFFVNANAFSSLEHVNRFTTGISLFLR